MLIIAITRLERPDKWQNTLSQRVFEKALIRLGDKK